MIQPIPRLGRKPLTRAAREQLALDLYRATTVARWAGCCRLCGGLITREVRGRGRRHETEYGAICSICNRAPLDTLEASDALAELADMEALTGRRLNFVDTISERFPMDSDTLAVPPQTDEEIASHLLGYQQAVRNALTSAVWAVHKNFHTPYPPDVAGAPRAHLIEYLVTNLVAAYDDEQQAKDMEIVAVDAMYAHLPDSVVCSIAAEIAEEVRHRWSGGN